MVRARTGPEALDLTRTGGAGRPVVFKPYRLETLANVLDEVLRQGARPVPEASS